MTDPAGGGRHGDESGPARTDPDVDLRLPADRGELTAHPRAVLGAIAAGGALGALARAALAGAGAHRPDAFAWGTFAVNVSGCLLIGALMAALARAGRGRPLLRPFLGVGVLGGYTTFSTYALDVHAAFAAGAPVTAGAYLAATVLGALLAVWLGDALTGWLADRIRPVRPPATPRPKARPVDGPVTAEPDAGGAGSEPGRQQ